MSDSPRSRNLSEWGRFPRNCKVTGDDSITKVRLQHLYKTCGKILRSTILHAYYAMNDNSLVQFWDNCNSAVLLYSEHLWRSTFAYSWMWHLRKRKDPVWMFLRRHIILSRICPVKALKPHSEDFLPTNDLSSCSLVPSEGNMCLICILNSQRPRAIFIIYDKEKFAKLTRCSLALGSNTWMSWNRKGNFRRRER